jgi:hypothetical protein
MLHLAQHVGQKEHLPVAGPSDERVLCVAVMLDHESRIFHSAFAAKTFEVAFPALAIWRIGEHEIEFT